MPIVIVKSAVRTLDDQERYILRGNPGSDQANQQRLRPIGGDFKLTRLGLRHLESEFMVGPEDLADHDGVPDVRFTVAGQFVDAVLDWFVSGAGRENVPRRTFTEQLTEGNRLPLSAQHIARVEFRPVGFYQERQERTGEIRLIQVFDMDDPYVTSVLAADAQNAVSRFHAVSESDIRAGYTSDGARIASICKALLSPQPTLK